MYYDELPEGVEFIDSKDFAESLDYYFRNEDPSDFVLRRGLFSDDLLRATAIIFAQGGSHESKNLLAALKKLKSESLFDLKILHGFPQLRQALSKWPAYQKIAPRLYNFLTFLRAESQNAEQALAELKNLNTEYLIARLIKIRGLGPGTIDPLLLYVFNKQQLPLNPALFKIARRHGLLPENPEREELEAVFMNSFAFSPEKTQYRPDLFLNKEKTILPDSLLRDESENEEVLDAINLGIYHENLLKISRTICTNKAPACISCPLGAMG